MTTSTTFVPAADKAARRSGQIRLHGPEDFEGMRKAGALAAEALDLIGPLVKPGVTTASLDKFVFEFARDHDAYPAPLNYRGYRKSICTSINHVVCHGIPDDKPLRDGDILNIDVTLIVDGWHGDASRMFVGRRAAAPGAAPDRRHLRGADARHRGDQAGRRPPATSASPSRPTPRASAARWCATSAAMGSAGCSTTSRTSCMSGARARAPRCKPGMFFTVEPMINLGGYGVKILSDGWTAVTRDRSLSAQFEHTVGVTETGCEIFTLSPTGADRAPIR